MQPTGESWGTEGPSRQPVEVRVRVTGHHGAGTRMQGDKNMALNPIQGKWWASKKRGQAGENNRIEYTADMQINECRELALIHS